MSRSGCWAVVVSMAVLSAGEPCLAQVPEGFPTPQKEHAWLKQFVGEWETEAEGTMGPDQPKMKCAGQMSVRMLGGFWMVSEAKVEMLGTQIESVQTIGYDPSKKKYVGSWVDSAMNHLWQYTGSVDESGKRLTLEAEGPSFTTPGKMSKFRDVYEFKSADHIAVESQMLTDEGKWVTFMSGHARRKK